MGFDDAQRDIQIGNRLKPGRNAEPCEAKRSDGDRSTNLELVQPGCVPGTQEPELLLGNQFAETIRASSNMLHQQAGYMDASDLCQPAHQFALADRSASIHGTQIYGSGETDIPATATVGPFMPKAPAIR